MVYEALKYRASPIRKENILWTLRQLCARQETLPESCILPIKFKTRDMHHAVGGFADVWKGTYGGKEVAFKSIRANLISNDKMRPKFRVRKVWHLQPESIIDTPLSSQKMFYMEAVLWKSLGHQNILELIGVCRWDDSPDATPMMVSEWMTNGNITEYISHNESQRMQLVCMGQL